MPLDKFPRPISDFRRRAGSPPLGLENVAGLGPTDAVGKPAADPNANLSRGH
jgi:hypothetical protein